MRVLRSPPAALLALCLACGRGDEAPPPQPAPPRAAAAAPPNDATPPIDAPTDAAAAPTAGKDVALESLDAMLGEIDAHWRKNRELKTPVAGAGFHVTEDNGVPVLIPAVDLPIAEVATRLRKRKIGKNRGLKMYTDGSLVAVDAAGAKVASAPIVLALNETLIIFLTPSVKDPKRLGRIDVAMP